MNINKNIPTTFAWALAKSVGLVHTWDQFTKDITFEEHNAEDNRLEQFQQMAIGCSFKDALIVYYDVDLSEKQKAALQVICKSTVPWLVGCVVGELMDNIDGKKAELILSELLKDGKVNPEVAKALVVKLQVVKAGDKL